jgi:hypothetical protein
MDGRLLLAEDQSQGNVVGTGTVVHFRTDRARRVETLAPCKILQVTDSGYCSCLP